MSIPGLFFIFNRKLICAASIGIAAVLILSPAAFSVPFIDEETELSIGKGADKDVAEFYGIYQDKSLQLYVDGVGQKLTSHLADKVFSKYFFKVVDSSEINAFALPGGYIYVTRGILATLNSEAELAGVMGHEIGHVTNHHGAKMMLRSIGAAILSVGGAIASPQNASKWLLVSTQMFQQINLGYGRDAELESDAQGMMNVTDAGYDPQGMVSFLRALRRQEIFSGQSYHSFQASHPETRERIIKAESLSTSLLARERRLEEGRETYLSRLEGLPFGGKRNKNDKQNYKDEYIDIYKVKSGDTFHGIAVNELGDKKRDLEIAVLNGMKETDPLVPGELLKLVKSGKYDKNKTLKLAPENP
ncbi:MAG: M48 family metalloprotease [Nitrospinae bacterium]|nr:M48 family metalloprotease [Nitrospinota bacterium]